MDPRKKYCFISPNAFSNNESLDLLKVLVSIRILFSVGLNFQNTFRIDPNKDLI